MNDSFYDEDLSENDFFTNLKEQYGHLIEQATAENWVVCVPRRGSFDPKIITEDDYYFHILTQNPNAKDRYKTLKGTKIEVIDGTILVDGAKTSILFEETFYMTDLSKYQVWCVECMLNKNRDDFDCNCCTVETLRDCIDFLWTESLEKNVLENLNGIINDFLIKYSDLYKYDLDFQKELIENLYKECLEVTLNDGKISESVSTNKFQISNVTVCVEAYIQHSIYKELMNGISVFTGCDDASFNKIVRNSSDTQLNHLNIRSDINDSIPCAKQHLAKINTFTTVIDKINCLRNTVTEIGIESRKKLSADDLIPIFVFLILKTCVPNWITNLVFLKRFHLTSEANFLVTTLEAAIEYIKSGISTPNDTEKNETDHLFTLIRQGDYDSVKNILENNPNPKSQPEINALCHPLCSCDRCEQILSKIGDNSSPTVHSSDDKGHTALHIACLYGKPKIVELLLEHGTDIHRNDYSGATALHYAALKGHQNALLLLLHSGANVNAVDSEKNTPLHFSSNNGHDACVKAILYFAEHQTDSINVNCSNIAGDTPLHHATKWGYKTIVQILLEYGADPNIENKLRKTPYDYSHNFNITQLILQAKYTRRHVKSPEKHTEYVPNERGVKPVSPNEKKRAELLLRAVAYGDVPMICYYLGLQIPNGHCKTLCHPLCDCENCQDDSGINVSDRQNINVCNGEGYTALHIASLHGQVDIVKLLLNNGAIPNIVTRKGLTPLHLACQTGRLEIVKLLLQCKGSQVNAQDVKGNTALHYACGARDARIVEILVKNKADVNIRNCKGLSAFDETDWKL